MFAENLKKFRKLAGLRQDDVARIIGLDRSAYAYYESGKTEPSIANLKKIAKAFGVDMNILIGCEAPEITAEFNSESFTYSAAGIVNEENLGKCNADERYLIACYRASEDKKAFMDAVSKLYESELG